MSPRPLLLVLLLTAPLAQAGGPKVVIDPGHGGKLEGATGHGGYKEGALCLELSQRIAKHLEKLVGAQVMLTRTEDVDLALGERVDRANRWKADVFLSIHGNSMPTRRLRKRAQGIETYFLSVSASGEMARRTAERENAEGGAAPARAGRDPLQLILEDLVRTEAHADSSRLAYAVHQRMVAATGAEDRGVQQAPFYVLNGVAAPAILIEVGFISHPEEGVRLRDPRYQEQLARAIAEGVKGYLDQVANAAAPTGQSAAR